MKRSRSAINSLQADSSFGEELEEAFNEDKDADVDAHSLLDFAYGGGQPSAAPIQDAMAPAAHDRTRVHFKVVYAAGGRMRLPQVPVFAGRRLTSADIVVSVHECVTESHEHIATIDRPQFLSGYTPSRMGLLCLADMNIEHLQEHTMQWTLGEKQFMINGIAPTDNTLSVITQFVTASAITNSTGRVDVMRIPKDTSSNDLLLLVHEFAERCSTYVTRVEDTSAHESWCLTLEGTKRLEVVHIRKDPIPVFKLPPTLPMIKDLSSYQLVLFLENHCNFTWCPLPKRTCDRQAISFRPADPGSPRFWISSNQGKINHLYLRALAAASEDSTLAVEVLHAQQVSYYAVLLGLEDAKKAKLKMTKTKTTKPTTTKQQQQQQQQKACSKLAIDDGDGDFPEPAAVAKRPREPLAVEDDDLNPPIALEDLEDDDVLELSLEEMLEAALTDEWIQDQADELEDVIEDAMLPDIPPPDGDEDIAQSRAGRDPSTMNHTSGPFRFTMKHKGGRFSWQCTCPFHRLSAKTACKKTMRLTLGTSSFEAEADRVHGMLQHWANQAVKYSRQRHHVALDVDADSMPSDDVVRAQAIEDAPRHRVQTDKELDGGEDDAEDMTGTSDDGGAL